MTVGADSTLTFAATVEQWHDFYLLTGTAAVTLLGLLFVAMSLHLEIIVREDGRHLRALAGQAFTSYLFVLLLSLLLLAPEAHARPTGFSLGLLGVLRLAFLGGGNLRSLVTAEGHGLDRRLMQRRILPPLAASVLLVTVAVLLIRNPESTWVLAFMVAVTGLMLASATGSAWDLIVRVGEARHRSA